MFILTPIECDGSRTIYVAIFTDVKNINFQMKISDIFLIFAQNIVRRFKRVPTIYVLEQK